MLAETWATARAKRAREAETPKRPSLGLMLRAPYFYPTPLSLIAEELKTLEEQQPNFKAYRAHFQNLPRLVQVLVFKKIGANKLENSNEVLEARRQLREMFEKLPHNTQLPHLFQAIRLDLLAGAEDEVPQASQNRHSKLADLL